MQGVAEVVVGVSRQRRTASTASRKLESLHKRRKLAVKAGDHRSIAHADRMIRILEEREAKEME